MTFVRGLFRTNGSDPVGCWSHCRLKYRALAPWERGSCLSFMDCLVGCVVADGMVGGALTCLDPRAGLGAWSVHPTPPVKSETEPRVVDLGGLVACSRLDVCVDLQEGLPYLDLGSPVASCAISSCVQGFEPPGYVQTVGETPQNTSRGCLEILAPTITNFVAFLHHFTAKKNTGALSFFVVKGRFQTPKRSALIIWVNLCFSKMRVWAHTGTNND